jgi:hypothetical protein
MDPDHFDIDPAFYFDADPYCFKKVMYLKRYFLFILTWFSLLIDLPGPNQQAYIVQFFLTVNFVVLIRVEYESGPGKTRNWSRTEKMTLIRTDPDPQHRVQRIQKQIHLCKVETLRQP